MTLSTARVLVALVLLAPFVEAFTSPLSAFLGHAGVSHYHPSPSALSLSDGNADDELSKLIGKRAQIKRKKREEIEPKVPDDEALIDLNLDKLPEFKTERPVRRIKKESDEEEEAASVSAKPDIPIVDFMAAYEDENDWHIPNRLGVSTRCWGDASRGFVEGGKLTKRMAKAGKFLAGDAQLAHTKLLEGGVVVFETSPAYGRGRLSAESILKRCLAEAASDLPETVLIENLGGSIWAKLWSASKAMVGGLETSLSTLDTPLVELYQVPKPRFVPSALVAPALAAVLESGQANRVGVVGCTSKSGLRRLQARLANLDGTLTSNAFDYALTNQKNEAMIDVCKELGIIPLITNPLDNGLASGVFTATNPSGGQTGAPARFSFKELEKLQPLHSVQETIAERVQTRVRRELRSTQDRFKSKYGPPPSINTDITTTQVALNYVIAKGGVPLPEVNTPKEAEEILGCLGWTLTDEEVDMLDQAAALCKL